MKIVFMGTPDFAVPSLEKLIREGFEVLAVVTNPDRPKNRGMQVAFSPVKECAIKNNIQVLQPAKVRTDAEFINTYKELKPDITIVIAFGQILPKEVLEVSKLGCINVHGSLLPKYRGAAPIQWSVINGDKTTGITTMYMDEGLDTGDMILKKEVTIGEDETSGELYSRLSGIGADLLIETLKMIKDGTAPREKQSEDFTYAPMLTKETGKIDWNKSSYEINSLVKGTNPWPGAYTEINGKKFKVHTAKIVSGKGYPGEVISATARDGFVIGTGDGAVELLEIQPENKKRMLARDYLLGNKI